MRRSIETILSLTMRSWRSTGATIALQRTLGGVMLLCGSSIEGSGKEEEVSDIVVTHFAFLLGKQATNMRGVV